MIDRQKIKNNAIVKKFYNATFALANQFYAIRYFFSSTKFDYNKKLFCQKYQISYWKSFYHRTKFTFFIVYLIKNKKIANINK